MLVGYVCYVMYLCYDFAITICYARTDACAYVCMFVVYAYMYAWTLLYVRKICELCNVFLMYVCMVLILCTNVFTYVALCVFDRRYVCYVALCMYVPLCT